MLNNIKISPDTNSQKARTSVFFLEATKTNKGKLRLKEKGERGGM